MSSSQGQAGHYIPRLISGTGRSFRDYTTLRNVQPDLECLQANDVEVPTSTTGGLVPASATELEGRMHGDLTPPRGPD